MRLSDDAARDHPPVVPQDAPARPALVAGIALETDCLTAWRSRDAPYAGDVLVVLSLRGGFDGLQAIVPTRPEYHSGAPTSVSRTSALSSSTHVRAAPGDGVAQAVLGRRQTFGAVHAVGHGQPEPLALRGDGGDGARGSRHLACGPAGSTACSGCAARERVPGRADGQQHGGARRSSGRTPELAMWSVDSFGLAPPGTTTRAARWDTALRGLHDERAGPARGPPSTALGALGDGRRPAGRRIHARDTAPSTPTPSSGTRCSDVARLIKADVGLQVAAVDYGDWDMHVDMGTSTTAGCSTS